jgi:hypothetical protein
MSAPYRAGGALLLLLAMSGGCGTSGVQVAPVSGHVTFDGQPLASAELLFQPDGNQRPSRGRTDAEGRYELAYKRGQAGAIVGTHTVQISISREVIKNAPIIAARFNTQSDLRREVKQGPNELDFDVTAEKADKK